MRSTPSRLALVLLAGVAYLAFLASFVYAIAFLGDLPVPKTVDSGTAGPWPLAVAVDSLLLGLFAIQHSVMARPAFKSWWTRIVPAAAERSVYVLAASALLALACWQWQPIPGAVWDAGHGALGEALLALSLAGWGLVVVSTFLINHFDLFGLRQAYLAARRRDYTHVPFVVRGAYALIRQPMMAGILIGVWAAPRMTAGHLLFAVLSAGYILVGTQLEERDLARFLGAEYAAYRRRVPMFVPGLGGLGRGRAGDRADVVEAHRDQVRAAGVVQVDAVEGTR